MGHSELVWQFQTVGPKFLQLMVPPPLKGAPYLRVLSALELRPQRSRQRGGGNTEGAAPRPLSGLLRLSQHRAHVTALLARPGNCRAEDSGDSVEGENRCWARQPCSLQVQLLLFLWKIAWVLGHICIHRISFLLINIAHGFPQSIFRAWG